MFSFDKKSIQVFQYYMQIITLKTDPKGSKKKKLFGANCGIRTHEPEGPDPDSGAFNHSAKFAKKIQVNKSLLTDKSIYIANSTFFLLLERKKISKLYG